MCKFRNYCNHIPRHHNIIRITVINVHMSVHYTGPVLVLYNIAVDGLT